MVTSLGKWGAQGCSKAVPTPGCCRAGPCPLVERHGTNTATATSRHSICAHLNASRKEQAGRGQMCMVYACACAYFRPLPSSALFLMLRRCASTATGRSKHQARAHLRVTRCCCRCVPCCRMHDSVPSRREEDGRVGGGGVSIHIMSLLLAVAVNSPHSWRAKVDNCKLRRPRTREVN